MPSFRHQNTPLLRERFKAIKSNGTVLEVRKGMRSYCLAPPRSHEHDLNVNESGP